ncbi:hypothetical protein CcrKarma_gp306 [Caulobacter virus Karma]|uniref:hypothetical protein n=1 Tax=Caulobacter virus Karma TaxID=1211641 RepID=UPI00028A449D|nr:hypothetical protein CcrKarma_gp306 [Caulobacter virus Karma]AFU87823.1 hypothetical protein CcrKarma_gp306 [Caulobacter virus Karma]
MSERTAIDILRHAAELLETRGWGQGATVVDTADAGGALCANIALGLASVRIDPKDYAAYTGAQVALLKHLGIDLGPALLQKTTKSSLIIEWNDAPERAAREVTDALRGAADGLSREAQP